MHKIIFHSFVLLLVTIPPLPSFAQSITSCPVISPTIKLRYAEPKLDRSKSFTELSTLSSKGAGGGHAGQSIVAGLYTPLTQVGVSSSFNVSYNQKIAYACFSKFEVTIEMDSTVYLASQIPPGGCMDQTVFEHESHHHAIQTREQNKAANSFFALNPLPSIPFHGSTPLDTQTLAEAYSSEYSKSLLQSFSNFVDPIQRDFDSPAEYERVSRKCAREMNSLLSHSNGH